MDSLMAFLDAVNHTNNSSIKKEKSKNDDEFYTHRNRRESNSRERRKRSYDRNPYDRYKKDDKYDRYKDRVYFDKKRSNLFVPIYGTLCQFSWIAGFLWGLISSFRNKHIKSNFIS